MSQNPPIQHLPRWIAYPFLLLVPIAGIYLGIVLGRAEVGSGIVLVSYHGTIVENWVLFLVGLGIVLFIYIARAYAQRSLIPEKSSTIIAVLGLAAMFFCGVWGLYGYAITLVVICVVGYFRTRRIKARPDGESETETQ